MRKSNTTRYHLYVGTKIWHKWTYLQNRNRLTNIKNRLAVAKWETGGKGAGSQHRRSHPWQGHVEETWRASQIRTRGTPWTCSSIYPKTRICLSYYFVPFTNSSDIYRGYPWPPFSGENQLRALANKSLGHERNISIQTPSVGILACLAGLRMWLFTTFQLWETWEA